MPASTQLGITKCCFSHMFWVIIYLQCEGSTPFYNIWLNLSREYNSVYLTIHLVASISSHIINSEPAPLTVVQACAIMLPPPCLTDDVVCFRSWAVSPLLHTFPNLLFQFLSVTSGFHLVLNRLDLHLWRHLVIADLDSDTIKSVLGQVNYPGTFESLNMENYA